MAKNSKSSKHTQVGVIKSLKRYGHKVMDTVLSEYAQLDNKSIFDLQYVDKLTPEARK